MIEPMPIRKNDLWFTEYQTNAMRLGLRITSILKNIKTDYQQLLVVETEEYGRALILDGALMFTDQNEFTYHEMMVHPLLSSHPDPRKVLVIGGGDGGCVREIVKYACVEEIYLVDIDEEVIKASLDFFPSVSEGLRDDRVTVLPMDALKFIKDHPATFDAIIVDSTDPVDFAVGLFEAPFYRDVAAALREEGMVVAQTESPFANRDLLSHSFRQMGTVFAHMFLCWGAMPTYPTGSWTYSIGSLGPDPRTIRRSPSGRTQYYSPDIHQASIFLPPFIEELLRTDLSQ